MGNIDPARIKMATQVQHIFEEKGTDDVVAFIQDSDDETKIMERYNNLVNDLYWQKKALHTVVPVAQAGIEYCLNKTNDLKTENPKKATEMQQTAQVIAFNLASYAWPGWDEQGIVITDDALAAGLKAAKLNVQLVTELNKGPADLSNAYWILGAQMLSAKDHTGARSAFDTAVKHAQKSGNKESELMNTGYVAIVDILEGTDTETAQKDFDASVKALKDINSDDANFFAQQLQDVLKVFTR
jgi:hypothetical protein